MTVVNVVVVPADEELSLRQETLEHNQDIEERIRSLLKVDYVRQLLLLRPSDVLPGCILHHGEVRDRPNVRATRLAMACGLLSARLYGDVVVARSGSNSLAIHDIHAAACLSPDLRGQAVPEWLADAAMHNYHDAEILERLAEVMTERQATDDEEDDSASVPGSSSDAPTYVVKVPLCLHCRRPTDSLCQMCHAAYFCQPSCREQAWSHTCFCATWQQYENRRADLSSCGLGDWHDHLVTREFQLSDAPYREYLQRLGIDQEAGITWWRTETDGWSGGDSESAKAIDLTRRHSYQSGFAPVLVIPNEERLDDGDFASAALDQRNQAGLRRLGTWTEYYRLRQLPLDSPVALLLTFPLTLYYSLVEFGEVPVTVARMLKRPLRVHVVGCEKELNLVDLFREVAFLLPTELCVELTFVIRQDVLPPSLRDSNSCCVPLADNLRVEFVSGTYGDSLDPLFDCGSGPPDMIIAFNAGLYAYESWRSVVRFLDRNRGVVGVFTDYNEMSAVQCASLGGSQARESVRLNPFRQPRAMSVYSMNLPQFSNGFFYILNQQEL